LNGDKCGLGYDWRADKIEVGERRVCDSGRICQALGLFNGNFGDTNQIALWKQRLITNWLGQSTKVKMKNSQGIVNFCGKT
jgi:hypothetical protein